jgi:nicotinamide-nucleotide amidase
VQCEVVAVGTELLLGQVVDTNSSFLGERLAMAGIDSYFQTKVGDNHDRVVAVLRLALERSDAVIVCGGLGPTQDDITREAIAEVMGTTLERDDEVADRIRRLFGDRNRVMAENNLKQADVPVGARPILQEVGTAPGLICPVGDDKVIYALPGVPHELKEMTERGVIPDLVERAGGRGVILSRVLRTWGVAESTLAEMIADRVDAQTNPTIAFLASGIEGLKVRITAKAESEDEANALIEKEEAALREVIGDLVFGVDDETMESAVGKLLLDQGLTVGVAESLTGGLVGSRLAEVEGCSQWFRGSIVAYDSKVKFDLLDVPEGPVVSQDAAEQMARGAAKCLGADVGISVTGVAGPAEQDGQPVGTIWMGIHVDGETQAVTTRLPGGRQLVRQFSTITLLNLLRVRLLAR